MPALIALLGRDSSVEQAAKPVVAQPERQFDGR